MMIEPGASIETGVDRLLALLREKKKLDIVDAAKRLGVSLDIVQEWADFLDEEGLLKVEYSLTKTYLVPRQLTKKELSEKQHVYNQKKDAFVSRVDTALQQILSEGEAFDKLKKKYDGLKEDLGSNLHEVEEEITELHHYEDLKNTFEQQAQDQQHTYKEKIAKLNTDLMHEEKRYDQVVEHIVSETNIRYRTSTSRP